MYSPYSFQVPISLIWQETVCLIAYSPVYLYRKTTHKKLHLKIIVTISLPRIEVSHSEEQMIILPRRLLEYFIGIGMKSLNIKRDMDSVQRFKFGRIPFAIKFNPGFNSTLATGKFDFEMFSLLTNKQSSIDSGAGFWKPSHVYCRFVNEADIYIFCRAWFSLFLRVLFTTDTIS